MRILVFGDSNSWGTLADGMDVRPDDRWPVVMGRALGAEVVEDCIPGRTTTHDDAVMEDMTSAPAASFNGLRALPGAMMAAAPVDLVLIMLGTNDMKARYGSTPASIAASLCELVDCIRALPFGPGPWCQSDPPMIGVISPVPLGPVADEPDYDRVEEWAGGRATSHILYDVLSVRMDALGVPVFDAGTAAEASPRDPIHFEADQHPRLGAAIASWVGATFPAPGTQ